jgi:hypothetical protein
VKDESEEGSSWDVVGAVGNLFDAMFNSEKKLARKLNKDHVVVWRLHNSSDYLECLCDAQFVRDWLQRRTDIDLKRVYLVTVLITVADAAMNRDASSSTTAGVKAQPPVTDLASHGASEALPKKAAESLDPKVMLKKGATAKAKISLEPHSWWRVSSLLPLAFSEQITITPFSSLSLAKTSEKQTLFSQLLSLQLLKGLLLIAQRRDCRSSFHLGC